MKVLNCPRLQCANCLDDLITTVSPDKQFVIFEHKIWHNDIHNYCPDLGKIITKPVSDFIYEFPK